MKPQPQTPLQRRYYWAVIRHIACSSMPGVRLSIAEKALHQEFKEILLGLEEVRQPSGEAALQPISTASLDHDEFSQYIEAVIAIAVKADVLFPEHAEDLLDVAPKHLKEHLPLPNQDLIPCA